MLKDTSNTIQFVGNDVGVFAPGEKLGCKARRRVGRGRGSGLGKTCGRGGKGQKGRSGVSLGDFEGGQTKLSIRLPRRGFNNIFKEDVVALNIYLIAEYIESGKLSKNITKQSMIDAGIVKSYQSVKILSEGECPAGISIECDKASANAIEKIQKAGSTVTLVQKS